MARANPRGIQRGRGTNPRRRKSHHSLGTLHPAACGHLLLTVAVAMAGAVAFTAAPGLSAAAGRFPIIAFARACRAPAPRSWRLLSPPPGAPVRPHRGSHRDLSLFEFARTTSVTLQFDLSRNIDFAARDVEAGMECRANLLPANLSANPTYRKVNPADAPYHGPGLTSDKFDRANLYDTASTIIQQKLSQIEGVGQVSVGGGTLPSVRVEVDPSQLSSMGLTLQSIQSTLTLQNTISPPAGSRRPGHRRHRHHDQALPRGRVKKSLIVGLQPRRGCTSGRCGRRH